MIAINVKPLPATIEHRRKPESACLLMALSSRRRVMPCARIRFVPKCIRPPSVLTKRNFISDGKRKAGREEREERSARKCSCPRIPGRFRSRFTSWPVLLIPPLISPQLLRDKRFRQPFARNRTETMYYKGHRYN